MSTRTAVKELSNQLMDPEYILEHAHLWFLPESTATSRDDIFMEFGDMSLFLGIFEDKDGTCRWTKLSPQVLSLVQGDTMDEKFQVFYDAATKNLIRDAKVYPMEDITRIGEMVESSAWMDFGDGNVPFVVTLNSNLNGDAVFYVMAKQIEEQIGCGFYVLPISVNEAILYPLSMEVTRNELESLLRAVRQNIVKPDERLSNSILLYKNGIFHQAKEVEVVYS